MRHAFVIPAYRESPYLRECIESLMRQQQRSTVLVTSSTPSPFLEALCREYELPLRINPAPPAIASDWNFALAASDADLVTLAHQDDLFFPAYSTHIIGAFQRYPQAVLAFTDHIEHTPAGPRPTTLNLLIKRLLTWASFGPRRYVHRPKRKAALLRWGNPISCPSVTLHRGRVPAFRFSDAFDVNLDWDAWTRLAQASDGGFIYLPQRLVSHRIHPGTETTASIADRRRLSEDLTMLQRFWPPRIARLIHRVYQLSYRANTLR